MIWEEAAGFRGALAERRRLLGLDLGTKTIGLALSDVSATIATPMATLRRTKFGKDAAALADICAEHQVGALVLGLPINMNGTEGPRCQSVRQFAANLIERFRPEIAFWDERLSTVAVEKGMIEADLSRKRRAELVDKAAAAYILQGALDFLQARA